MAKDNEGQSLREYENRKKRYKKRRTAIISMLILVLIIVGAAYLYHLYNRNFQGYEVLKTTESIGENAIGYLSYDSAIVKYSKDGAEAINQSGDLLWNGSYEMKNPIADTCGKYVVVADKGGNSIQIFDEEGAAGSITTLYDIIKVEIASQGVVVALMEEGEMNYITLYDVYGTVLDEKGTDVSISGYPIDIALSNDGEKLVVSYLSVTKGELISTVAFFNFGEVGQNYTDRFVGGYEFKDIIIPRVAFIDNNTACVYKENGFLIYSIDEIPSMLHEENLEGNIKSILYDSKYIGVVLEGEDTTGKQLLLYDLTGKKVLDHALDFDYTTIFLAEEEIIMHDNLSCVIMKPNGKVKFQCTFDENIAAFLPINNLDRYFLINASEISEISLVE